jgi:hypothetical protein
MVAGDSGQPSDRVSALLQAEFGGVAPIKVGA